MKITLERRQQFTTAKLSGLLQVPEPFYHGVINSEIQEIPFEGGKLRLLAGNYKEYKGIQGKYLPLDYYHIVMEPGASFTFDVKGKNKSAMVFTLLGDAEISVTKVSAKTAAKLGDGEQVEIKAYDEPVEICFMCSEKLGDPVAWNGPIVMNTDKQLWEAFQNLEEGKFIKSDLYTKINNNFVIIYFLILTLSIVNGILCSLVSFG